MSTFDIIFWLLIALIAVLAYAIESGLSARHRALVLSSILSATGAAIFMMFWVQDDSKFGTGKQLPPAEKTKPKVYADNSGDGEKGLPEFDVVEGAGPNAIETEARYEDDPLLKRPGGFRDCDVCPLMTMVPAGDFMIGSPADEAGRRDSEGPRKLIRLKRPFTVSRYEIQFGDFAAFVREARYRVSASCTADDTGASVDWQRPGLPQATPQHPVVCLSWHDAKAYAQWLTDKTKRIYRLPSEAEWEYVARAGTASAYWAGTGINPSQANFAAANGGTTPGGKYADNPFKLFDVAGNVWEMTEDCWNDTLARIPDGGVAELGLGNCEQSPLRGGAWNSAALTLRSAYRRPLPRVAASNSIGFRLVREIK